MDQESSAGDVGLRERKKDDTRRSLIDIAYRFTLDRGFDGFTIAEIAEAAGVSRRTFSNYFSSKAECVMAANDSQAEQAIHELRTADPSEPVDQLIRRLLRLVTTEADGEWGDFAQTVHSHPELRAEAAMWDQRIAGSIAAAIAQRLGIATDDLVAQALSLFAMTACRLVIERWLQHGRQGGREAVRQLLERVFLLLDPRALESLRLIAGHPSTEPD